ncbi:maleylacetate reductase [Bradyrhizobium sp. AUGA SZCCT0283]|uniref:maleylacetate reductase n=1 Tax=Bradyrhizobium sp. AUGA SZCCT0283 TaxID=2807671 RepID=UPI001BAB0613|nr:maleylacetate reductase [Bradyrhizobium sp. AUGA SZCCT0283]MBR1273305.1 maleylacetate reductase [Bradyrhizobium sp. AUGA SZCCT0283]
MLPFTYVSSPGRVLFGSGRTRELAAELERLGCRRAFVVCTPDQEELALRVAAECGARAVFAEATMHTPVAVTQAALSELQAAKCDSLVAIGGGSTIGLSKALALRTDLPQVAVPTTYAGSEMTPILGETSDGRKTTLRSYKVLPEVAIYDVDLTLSLPPGLSAVSGVNAIAHAVEALYAPDTSPIISLMAEEGIAALGRALPRILTAPSEVAAREAAQYGAWLSGVCLGSVAMGLHHKICHVLGGTFDLRHAETHAVMLPHVVAYNSVAAPAAMARVANALKRTDAASGLFALNRALANPLSLAELGMPREGIAQAVEQVMKDQYSNPRPLEAAALQSMLARAWSGEAPRGE